MINMTLKQLRYFEVLARTGHFGRAASLCAISQPALSEQIKDLEEALSAPLFERGARRLTITKFGEEFAVRVRDILRAVDELEGLARASRDRALGRLRLGVIPTIAPYLLPALVRELGREFADMDLNLRETMTATLIEELAEGQLDAAIVALPIGEPTFTEAALFEEEFLLVRPKQEEGQPTPTIKALRGARLLLLEEGHCFREQALAFCKLNAVRLGDVLDASSLSTLVQMVGAGLGVTLIPEMAVPVEMRSAPVSVARFDRPKPSRTVGMIWRKTSPLAKHLVLISHVVRAAAENLRKEDKP